MNPLLEVKDVCLSYHSLSGETAALSHISFHLMPEEFLAVVGPSGCGKSTLLNLICGLLHAESGTILMNGKPLNKQHLPQCSPWTGNTRRTHKRQSFLCR